jgi:hypothetical protein
MVLNNFLYFQDLKVIYFIILKIKFKYNITILDLNLLKWLFNILLLFFKINIILNFFNLFMIR